jgi:hypothetical protein
MIPRSKWVKWFCFDTLTTVELEMDNNGNGGDGCGGNEKTQNGIAPRL